MAAAIYAAEKRVRVSGNNQLDAGGNFVLTVKNNQPEACKEIHSFMDKLEEETAKERSGGKSDSVWEEYLEKYEEIHKTEKKRDRYEYRTYKICNDALELTKAQKERRHIKRSGQIRQVRVPIEKDSMGNNITPSKEEFLKRMTRTPAPAAAEGTGKYIQCVAMVSDRLLTAEELGGIKRCQAFLKCLKKFKTLAPCNAVLLQFLGRCPKPRSSSERQGNSRAVPCSIG